jgi:hypothetical protein
MLHEIGHPNGGESDSHGISDLVLDPGEGDALLVLMNHLPLFPPTPRLFVAHGIVSIGLFGL